jgi:Ser/Thr protein kinase RdoA (MazF antagonist)
VSGKHQAAVSTATASGWTPWSSPALDPKWLEAHLQSYLAGPLDGGAAVRGIEILHARAKPERMTLLYRMSVRAAAGEWSSRMFIGQVVPAGRLEAELRSALECSGGGPSNGRSVIPVPEAELILVAYPFDRKLRLPSQEELEAWTRDHLDEIAEGVAGERLRRLETEVLRFVPEKRWTARCRATLKSGDGTERVVTFIAKQYNTEDKAKRLYRRLRSLRPGAPGRPGHERSAPALPVPRALAIHQSRALVFTEAMRGEILEQVLPHIEIEPVLGRVGAMLAEFHSARLKIGKSVSPKTEREEVREAARLITLVLPELSPRLEGLLETFETARNPKAPEALLHGSFRLNHVMIDGADLSLLDLDSLRTGPPAYDIANFLSSLYYLEAEGRLGTCERQQVARGFLEGYGAAARWDLPPEAVLWFLAGLLIDKQAIKYATRPREDRERKILTMVTLAEESLVRRQSAPPRGAASDLWSLLP